MPQTILQLLVFGGAVLLIIKNAIELRKKGTNETRTKALKFANVMLVLGVVLYLLSIAL